MTLKLRALGEFQLELDGTDVTAQLDATRIFLLTYLLDRGPQSRAHLAELLWPERPTGRARSNLRTLITRLRPLLSAYLQTDTTFVALPQTEQVWFDVQAFSTLVQSAEQLAQDAPTRMDSLTKAVTLFQGDFLANVASAENEALESWLMTRRLQLHGQAVQVLRRLVQTDTVPLAQRLDHARQLMKFEPLDEEGCRTLMRLLAEHGQRDEALWHFQRYQRDLTETWSSATPSEDLVMLAAKIRLGMAVDPVVTALHPQDPVAHPVDEAQPDRAQETSAAAKAPPSAPPSAQPPAPTINRAGSTVETQHRAFPPFPTPIKPLIGRTQEREQFIEWLHLGYRLISITGLGGVGKSHFVQTVIAAEPARWRDGVLFVALPEPAAITESAQRSSDEQQQQAAILQLSRSLATALGLTLQTSQEYADQVARALAPYAGCLVLDNFERVLPAAPYLQSLLARAGKLTVVAISRRPLHLAIEAQIALGGLPLPAAIAVSAVAAAERATLGRQPISGTAVELLALNITRHRPDLQLTPEDHLLLHRICQVVRGLPLALEMVPALTHHISLRAIAERLEMDPLTLTADFADLPAQHRSLYTLMDATFTAVPRSIQEALVRLIVFAGPFSTETAHAVITRQQWHGLQEQGWLETVDGLRFTLHPLIAAFVHSLCVDQQWATVYAQARRAHARYYATLVDGHRFFQNPHYTAGATWLRQQFAEITTACQTFLAEAPEEAVPLLHVIAMYGHHFGDQQTVYHWLRQGLDTLPTTLPARFRLLLDYVACTTELRDVAAANAALAEARADAADQDDQAALLALYERLAWAAHTDYAADSPQRRQEGRQYFSQGLALAEAMGDQSQVVNMLAHRAFFTCWQEDSYAQAQADLQRALTIAHRAGRPGVLGIVYKIFAYVEFVAGRLSLAQRYSERAIQHFTAEEGMRMTLGWSYMERSQIALAQRDTQAARHYLAQASEIFHPVAYEAGLTQYHTLLGIVALLEEHPDEAERYWLRAYRAVQQMNGQDKLMVTLTVGIGLTQLMQGDPLLGAQLVAAASAQYAEKAFHWVPPEQRLMVYLLERATAEIEALALPPVSVDEQMATQALRLMADSLTVKS